MTRSDVCAICKQIDKTLNARGTDFHKITSILIATVGVEICTTSSEVIIILNQYSYHGKEKTIHLSGKLESCKNTLDNKSIKVGVKQHATALDKHKFLFP